MNPPQAAIPGRETKTLKTPHLPTWLFTEKTGFRRGFPGLVNPKKTSPDLESICALVAEGVTREEGRKAPLPKGIGDETFPPLHLFVRERRAERPRCRKALVTPARRRNPSSLSGEGRKAPLPKGIGDYSKLKN